MTIELHIKIRISLETNKFKYVLIINLIFPPKKLHFYFQYFNSACTKTV